MIMAYPFCAGAIVIKHRSFNFENTFGIYVGLDAAILSTSYSTNMPRDHRIENYI